MDLQAYIAEELERWHNPYPLQRIFGMAEPRLITEQIDAFCARKLGSGIASTLFYEVSIGVVCGLQLVDGRRIVLKLLGPDESMERLRGVTRVQGYLLEQGYPCTRPICGPLALADGIALVEELDDLGEYHDAHQPLWRRKMAELLAWQLRLLNRPRERFPELDLALFDKRLPVGVLWGKPHSNIFDFEATARGAEWIDALARQARGTLDNGSGELVLGHVDWSTKHIRYLDEQAHVIYDWDSLQLDKEPVLVGHAAMTFTYIPFMPNISDSPSREEMLAFIADYEMARGRPFSAEERRTLAASMTVTMAYGARCEHSLAPDERDYPEGSRRAILARYQGNFLPL
ncbi:hypothetical protein [Dictyobacter aurantiacus]|uniref:Aminoglycoside phosphotransferase domain-containing protein n=1 Tax=Dictyobacter aurantiacus TaxID=1936993 RepID=A0A401ZJL6_9CHLR|nr:hypothetical protein [Dictyobacter aurantiacus]GCE07057.1 hypothetical protein KDAU_43860 [Dictyobacter aurantiacus]